MSEAKHGRLTLEAFRLFQALSPEDRLKTMLSIKAHSDQRFSSRFWEEQCKLHAFELLSPTHCIATFAFTADKFYCNGSGNLHGGAQAMMFDMCTSLAAQSIAAQPDTGISRSLDSWINAGVSRTLAVNYLRPAAEGLDLLMECEVVQIGRTMALLRGVLKRADDGTLLSTCEHTKAAVQTKPGFGSDTLSKAGTSAGTKSKL